MENQANSKSIIINYGLILGVLGVLLHLTMYATNNLLDPHWSFSALTFILFIGIIVFGIKKYKEANGGFLSWIEAVKIGVGIAIISALISTIYTFIFNTYIEPDFINQSIEFQNQKMLASGYTEEQIESANALTEKMKNPTIIAAMGIIGSAIGGFVVAAIAGAIMKKSEEEQY